MTFWWARLIFSIGAGVIVGLSVPTTIWWVAVLVAGGTTGVIALIMDGLRWSYRAEHKRQEGKT